MADVPRTEVYFADTYDELGPFGAKSMSESPYNPVAPALGNAIRDAIGVRPYETPFSRDRIWRMLVAAPPRADYDPLPRHRHRHSARPVRRRPGRCAERRPGRGDAWSRTA